MYFCLFLGWVIQATISKKQSVVLPGWLEGSHSVCPGTRGHTAQRLQPQILLISANLRAQKHDADVQI